MNAQNDERIDKLIGGTVSDGVPADVDRLLRSQLKDFRHRLGAAERRARHRPATLGRRLSWGAAATIAAATALAALFGWILRPRVSLADVAATLFQQPWIHGSETGPDGEVFEVWYSPTDDVSAWCRKDWIDYHDHRLKIHYSYDVAEKILYRMPEYRPRRADRYAAIAAAFRVLLEDERLVDTPIERMEFLGDKRKDMKLVDQTLEKVEQSGRPWLDYRLTVRYLELPDPVEMLIRVDPETKLPHFCRVEGRFEGRHMVSQTRFDYPSEGPADVYDLGVPKTAKRVDRIPSDDLARILETIRAGRERMDDYRALVVQRDDRSGWADSPILLYRKGDKFSADLPYWGDSAAWQEKPADGKDLETTWRERINLFRFIPVSVEVPSKTSRETYVRHSVRSRTVKNPDGSLHREIESIEKHDYLVPRCGFIPPYYSLRPEFACRPPMGGPSQELEAVLEQDPAEGPPGTILLHLRRTGRMPRAPDPDADKLPPRPDAYRFWLDPARDYVVVRRDMISGGDSVGEESVDTTIVEEMAQSPQGTWYATQTRRKDAIRDSNGETYDQVTHICVDFDVDLPDSLFEPPEPGKVYR